MRDIELIAVPSVPADPALDDAAYGSTEGAGLIASDTTLTDPSMTDTKAYGRPSLGGEFGPGRAAILGAPVDGGEALLGTDTVVTVTDPVVPLPAYALAGRSANNSSFLNLFPWHKTPPEGLDMNNPNPPPAPPPSPSPSPPPPATLPLPTAPAPAHGITVTGASFSAGMGTVSFSGPSNDDADVLIQYVLVGGTAVQHVHADIEDGDTATQVAAKVRAALNATGVLVASGTGGTVNIIGSPTPLAGYNISLS